MLTRVRAEVVAATRGKQVPWSNSSLLGDVYLVEKWRFTLSSPRHCERSEAIHRAAYAEGWIASLRSQ